jgi:glycosyltransferase involved in cell wall biosynthesis
VRIHQVLSGAGPFDAVSNQARAFRSLFDEWGWGGSDVAAGIDPRVGSTFKPLGSLAPSAGDTLLIHYSAYAPKLRAVLDRPERKVLLSHNVTPARWFWEYEPRIAIQCALGRQQMGEYAARCEVVAGVSAYNAAELGSDRVVPILFDPAGLGAPRMAEPGGAGLLFVGRLTPHKRQDELIRLVAHLRGNGVPDATLTLVGEPMKPWYLE